MSQSNRQPKRTGRRAAAKLATSTHPSAPSAFLPQTLTRAMRRGRQRIVPAATADATANFGAVLEFTEPNGRAEIDYSPVYYPTNSPTDATGAAFSLWIKTTVKTAQYLFQTAYSAPDIWMQNDQITVSWAGQPAFSWTSADTRPISDGEWHHIAVVFAGGVITVYKDGVATLEAPQITDAPNYKVAHPVFMGGTWNGIPSYIGQMWAIKIWSVSLTASQVQADMYDTYSGNTYPANLVLFSAFNVATNSVTNRTGNVPGTLTNADVTWDALPASPTYAFQIPGGGGDYVDIGAMTPVSSTAATFECWLKMSDAPGVSTTPQTILLSGAMPGAPLISYGGGETLELYWGESVRSADARPISDGGWHHIAVTFNNNVVTFFKDGLPTNETFTLSATLTSAGGLQLGPGGNTGPFNGLITDVRVWSVARSVGDIQANMYATLTGTESGLVALCNLSYLGIAPILGIRNQVNNAQGAVVGNARVIETVGPQSQQPVPQSIWTYPISGIAPLGPQISPKGLIYAENVAASNAGPAGNYLRSLDLQDHTLNWTYSVHDNSAIPTPVIPASVGVGNTVAYVAAQAQTTSGSKIVELHAVDFTTGQPVWAAPATLVAQTTLTKPVESGGLVVIGANYVDAFNDVGAALFWVDTALGTTVKSYTGIGGVGKFMTDPLIQSTQINGNTATVAYFATSYGDNLNLVFAINLSDGSLLWGTAPGGPTHVPSGGMTLDRDRLYVTCADGTVTAMNLADGSVAWSKAKTNLAINSKPVVIGTAVYVGSTDGSLYAFDGPTGDDLWQLNAGSAISTDLIAEDGAIYFATQGNGVELPPTFFSVDSASQGNDVLIYPVPDADTILFDQGQSNGVAYFYGKQNVYAVNMDMILHEFNVDTKLIVEDYDTSADPSDPSSQAVGNDTSYRITLALFDPLKMPRVNQAVKVWASSTVYLANVTDSQGTRLQIGPTTPLWVQTDGSGKVTLAVSAYDDGSKGGTGSSTTSPLVNCPAVYAWANFMMPGEAIVIYPDHEHLGKMANVQGQSSASTSTLSANASSARVATDDTLYLNTATGYDGSKLILSGYQDSTSLTNIATTMRNVIGTRNQASVSKPNGVGANAPANKYIAFPASMPSVNYASDNTQPTTRPFVPGADPVFTMDISGASGVPTSYQPTYDDSRPSNLPPPSTVATGVVTIQMADGTLAITSIGDFFKKVVKGTEKVAKVAWKFAVNAVNTVIHTAESVYNLVITSVEDAITAVVGFLKSVVADIKKAIEWLSALFNWGAILANHRRLKQQISNPSDPNNPGMLDRLQSWLTKQINLLNDPTKPPTDIDTVHSALSGKGQSSMASAQSQTAGTTVQSVQGQNNNPNNVYNYSPDGSPQNNSSQCQWMQQKTNENASGATTDLPAPSAYRQYFPWVATGRAPGVSSTHANAAAGSAPWGAASGPDGKALKGIFDDFVTTLLTTIANDFADFPAQVNSKANTMGNKLGSSKSILGSIMADIIAVFETLADDVIEIGKDVAGAFLQMVNSLLSQLVTWLNTPIHIPFVSALYKLITHGDALTMLDLAALMVAVPTTVLMKVIAGVATPAAYVAARAEARAAGTLSADAADIDVGQLFSGIATVIMGLITSGFDAFMLAISIPFNGNRTDIALKIPSFIDLALDVLGWALGMVENFAWKGGNWAAQDWVFWAIQGWTPLMSFIFSFASNTIVAQTFRDFLYGFVFLVVSICYADVWPADYKDAHGAKGLVFTANFFSSLNSMVEINLQPEEEAISDGTSDVVAIAGKVLCGGVSAILSFSAFVDTLVHPPSSAQLTSQKASGGDSTHRLSLA